MTIKNHALKGQYNCAAHTNVEMANYLFEKLEIKAKLSPCKSRFDCNKIQNLIGYKLPTWQKMLDDYLEKNYA